MVNVKRGAAGIWEKLKSKHKKTVKETEYECATLRCVSHFVCCPFVCYIWCVHRIVCRGKVVICSRTTPKATRWLFKCDTAFRSPHSRRGVERDYFRELTISILHIHLLCVSRIYLWRMKSSHANTNKKTREMLVNGFRYDVGGPVFCVYDEKLYSPSVVG